MISASIDVHGSITRRILKLRLARLQLAKCVARRLIEIFGGARRAQGHLEAGRTIRSFAPSAACA